MPSCSRSSTYLVRSTHRLPLPLRSRCSCAGSEVFLQPCLSASGRWACAVPEPYTVATLVRQALPLPAGMLACSARAPAPSPLPPRGAARSRAHSCPAHAHCYAAFRSVRCQQLAARRLLSSPRQDASRPDRHRRSPLSPNARRLRLASLWLASRRLSRSYSAPERT